MSPSGGAITLVDQPMTWSPVNSVFSLASAKHRWFEVWPGVSIAARLQPGPLTVSPSRIFTSGEKSWSPPSSTAPNSPARTSAGPGDMGAGALGGTGAGMMGEDGAGERGGGLRRAVTGVGMAAIGDFGRQV